ncbi:MAG: bacterio-opsin activator domain-containing protein [Halodesulfurarchaeum sp.]
MKGASAIAVEPAHIDVLLVDDDSSFAQMARTFLERNDEGLAVAVETEQEPAFDAIEAGEVDAVVADYRMPSGSGLDFLERVRGVEPELPFFLLTGFGSEEVASEAISAGVTDYFRKEGSPDQYGLLANRIRNAVEKRRAEQSVRENEQFLQAVFDGVQNGLAVVNGDHEVVRANEWLERRVGGPLSGRKCYEVLRGVQSPEAVDYCPVEETIGAGEPQRLETELTHMDPPFWAAITTATLPFMGGNEPRVLVQVQDVTDRKRREWKLQKRERLYRALQEHTEECIAVSSTTAVLERIAESVSKSTDYGSVAVLGFDPEEGTLAVEEASAAFESELGSMEPARPGSGPLWEAFQEDRSAIIDGEELASAFERSPASSSDFVVMPLGDHGLILVHRTTEVEYPEIDIEGISLCAANARTVLDRIRKERELGSATDRVSAQAGRIENLQSYLQAIRRIHGRIAEADSRGAVEECLVSELVETEVVDFAWIGRPGNADGTLSPSTWAGRGDHYLDRLDLSGDTDLPPARQAADHRKPVRVPNIAQRLQEGAWAKAALSSGFQSVSAFPIEYGGVLYGVLAVYSSGPGVSDQHSEALLADVTALAAANIRVQNIHAGDSNPPAREVVFSITDSNHLFYMLWEATGVPVSFETVLESDDRKIRLVISVPDHADESVLRDAETLTRVEHATWFGNPSEGRVLLKVLPPFIGTEIAKHGGQLRGARADADGSTVTIGIPANVDQRPVLEWLQDTYRSAELVAKRDPETRPGPSTGDPLDALTERQTEVLEAAYEGGYFENPRSISGEELAAAFDLSGSAVYKHLRAAQRRLLERLLD